jgi:phytoene dehydrogenase-like protein
MLAMNSPEAIVVGSGPNGLVAAVRLGMEGYRVRVVEARATIGGGARTEEVTLPGYRHDICSAIHPMAIVSPAFRTLSICLDPDEWAWSPFELAHPFDDGTAATLSRSVEETATRMGEDGPQWLRAFVPFVRHADELFEDVLRPIRLPRYPGLMARFGMAGLQSAESFVRRFRRPETRAIFGGCAAHGVVPLDRPASASFGLMLALTAHVGGWPCARGGSARIIDALAQRLRALGGAIETDVEIRSLADLPSGQPLLMDLTPRQLLAIAGDRFPESYRKRLGRFRYGPGVFKIDWALDGPVPWTAPECRLANTIHLGGTFEEIAIAESAAWNGGIPHRPFVLFAQQSLFDPTRAPDGKQTGWAYCHVPHGSTVDMTDAIERQVERFAPGFRDRILARSTLNTAQIEDRNPNMIGGDIGGGANDLMQLLLRPFPRWNPYRTPRPDVWLCSSSTPPGGGVHGMCGLLAAESLLGLDRFPRL